MIITTMLSRDDHYNTVIKWWSLQYYYKVMIIVTVLSSRSLLPWPLTIISSELGQSLPPPYLHYYLHCCYYFPLFYPMLILQVCYLKYLCIRICLTRQVWQQQVVGLKKTIYIFYSGPFDLLNFSTFCDIFFGSPYFSNDGINPNEYSFLSCTAIL